MKIYKIVLLGTAFVGKSSLILRILHNRFEHYLESTIGAAFFTYNLNDETKLEIWDTSGQEKFNSLVKMYYRKASVAFLVFDVNNKKTFEDVKKWIHDLHVNEPLTVPIVFANKCDLDFHISKHDYEDYFKSNNIDCITCSAKTGEGLESFFKLLETKLEKNPELELKREFIVQPEENQKGYCC